MVLRFFNRARKFQEDLSRNKQCKRAFLPKAIWVGGFEFGKVKNWERGCTYKPRKTGPKALKLQSELALIPLRSSRTKRIQGASRRGQIRQKIPRRFETEKKPSVRTKILTRRKGPLLKSQKH